MNTPIIYTDRLRLVAGTSQIANAAITNRKHFSSLLNAQVPDAWPQALLKEGEPVVAAKLAEDPEAAGWWIWYIIVTAKNPSQQDLLIGNGGFCGRPSDTGRVEVGYAVLEEFQRNGYATEATKALVQWASRQPGVSEVIADTFASLGPSIRVMEKCGMTLIGPGNEECTIRHMKHFIR